MTGSVIGAGITGSLICNEGGRIAIEAGGGTDTAIAGIDDKGGMGTMLGNVMVMLPFLVTDMAGTDIGEIGAGLTLTLKVADAALPEESVAIQVTVVVPIAKRLPEAGVQDTGTVPSRSSVAVGCA